MMSLSLFDEAIKREYYPRRYFASISVTDMSPFVKVPEAKHQPSLPAMVYLEKEVMTLNANVNEFKYSSEYIDHLFKSQ